MRLFLLICPILFYSIYSQTTSCPNNRTYGLYCNLSCTNCLIGCDISGSCINSTCSPSYYGNICNNSSPRANIPSIVNLANTSNPRSPCAVTISTIPYNRSLNRNISPINYYVIYGTNDSLSNRDPAPDNGILVQMSFVQNTARLEANIQFNLSAFYRFAIYFTFEDITLFGTLNGLASPVYQTFVYTTNCSTSDTVINIPTSATPPSTIQTTTRPIPSAGDLYVTTMNLVPNSTFIEVRWTLPRNTSGLTGFNISINNGASLAVVNNSTFFYNITNLSESTTYIVTVASIYNIGSFLTNRTTTTLTLSAPTNLNWNKITGIISWNPPVTTGFTGYKIYVNSSAPIQVLPSANQYNMTSLLLPGTYYVISIAAVYSATRESNGTTTLWTKPAPFVFPLNPPYISNQQQTSFNVIFPNYTNYNGIINIYLIAVQVTSSLSRQKRDTFSCNPTITGLPSGASVRYANNVNPGSQSISIGSGQTFPPLNCANDQLSPGTNYTVYAIVGSLIDSTGEYAISTTTFVTPGSNAGMIAGIIIGILLLLLLIILLIIFLKRRKKQPKFFGIKGPYEDIKPMSHSYWSNINDKMHSRKIILENKNILEGVNFKDEYDNLPKTYCDDHNGVELSILNHTDEYSGDRTIAHHHSHKSNYTLSLIDGYIKKKAFISIQTPYDEQTIADFWLMVYSDNVGQIVMMTTEGEVLKQNTYWPTKTEIFDLIEVTLISEDRYAYFDVRTFKIRKIDSKENISVTQYHYRSWPQNDKLVNIPSFIEFHQLIKRSEDIMFGPTLVHSRLDCPLNAVYIGFDILNDQLSQESEVNVYRTFAQLRRYRANMMVTIDQYMIVYDFLFESYVSGRYVVDLNLKDLMDSKTARYWRFLENQFEWLVLFKDLTYRNKINKEKFYILDSVECAESIILAQLPSHLVEEIINLWDIIFAKDVSIIVDFQNRVAEEMSYVTQNVFNYQISVKNVVKGQNDVMTLKLSVTKLDTNDTKLIIVYSINSRNTLSYDIEECDIWVELISSIMNDCNYHILVFNTCGSYLSSIFLACFNAACKMNYFRYVSVYFTIRSLQASGHEIVQTHDEFKFIFGFLRIWIDIKLYNGNYEDRLQFDGLDPESPFKRGLHGKLYPELNNSLFPQYSSPKGQSYHYPNNKYETET